MLLPLIHHKGKRWYRGFVLLLVGMLFITAGVSTSGRVQAQSASLPDCTLPNQCLYLPSIYLTPNPRVRAESVLMYKNMYLASVSPADGLSGWAGSLVAPCNPGDTPASYRSTVLLRLNYFRLMAGVPPLSGLKEEYNEQAQAAALIMSANNNINFNPPTSWLCYSAAGSAGAQASIMTGNYNGSAAVDYYMSDNGATEVGHRRFILYPQTREMGDGEIPATTVSGTAHMATSVLRIYDDHYYDPRPLPAGAFVSWPPAAYVPYQVVYPLWSFSYPDADFSHATLSVISTVTPTVTRYPPVNGYGENTLVWRVGGWDPWARPAADTPYVVTIRNVLVNGLPYNFSYTVTIYDPES